MSQKASVDQINFNYPIPRSLHQKVKMLQVQTGMKVKDIVVNALVMYVSHMNKTMEEDTIEKALNEPHGTNAFEEDDL